MKSFFLFFAGLTLLITATSHSRPNGKEAWLFHGPEKSKRYYTGYTRIKAVCDRLLALKLLEYSCGAEGYGNHFTRVKLKEPCGVLVKLAYSSMWDDNAKRNRDRIQMQLPTARGVNSQTLQDHMGEFVKVFTLGKRMPEDGELIKMVNKCSELKSPKSESAPVDSVPQSTSTPASA